MVDIVSQEGFKPWRELTPRERKSAIRFLDGVGFTSKEMGKVLQVDRSQISAFCRRNFIVLSRLRGAQLDNKNAQTANGMAINTIQRKTRKILKAAGRDLFLCERCGGHSVIGECARHHKDRDRSNNIPSNIEVLCPTCHALEHIAERVRNDKGQFI